ncbi:hypothetical protein SKAU_G00327230 [Synaphobranchus kaupii]|uniref:Teneurin N-terminal domain-containing protein n=1 Tax=Synaphobranchus kaupii TaxID=118154 RepID=A0A9Q1IJF2_SYNKA|nr:hypothetical protein SKAU_G00327230 [Synaphobranchus kaupii]
MPIPGTDPHLSPVFNVEAREGAAMDIKERKPYRSLTARRDAERRYTSSSADSEDGRPQPKSYSSSETLKAFDQDSRLAYGSRVKDLVHQEADEFCRQGADFSLQDLGFGDAMPSRGAGYHGDMGMQHRGYSVSVGSDADTETDGVMSPEHVVRLWGRTTKSGRSSCLSSRANSNLTLTDTEHENTENGPPLHCSSASSSPVEQGPSPPPSFEANENQRGLLGNCVTQPAQDSDSDSEEEFAPNSFLVKPGSGTLYSPAPVAADGSAPVKPLTGSLLVGARSPTVPQILQTQRSSIFIASFQAEQHGSRV